MSVNDGIDPRLLFHVEDESLRFRVGDSVTKTRELETVGDRGFGVGISGIRQVFSGTNYSDGENDGVSVPSHGVTAATESKNTGSWELVVREDEEEKLSNGKKVCNSHNKKQSKREKVNQSTSSWESLKSILSDPVTGVLMNDATILPCGHSFGAGGLKEVQRMKACFTCSQPTSEGSEKPNLSLRIVVHAFRLEQESDHIPSVKRRKERSDQHKRSFCNQNTTETPKSSSRGIQFPFSIGDHIIIEGNKRTPPRFVGRKAVIMTHCLNGWYVVKTVDNAESIKLQHCSLAKISDNSSAKVTVAEMAPSWL